MADSKRVYILFFCTMFFALLISMHLRPQQKLSDLLSPVQLNSLIPETFGQWRNVPQYSITIVNPEINDLLSSLYDQVLNRFYKNAHDELIMLSISYGDQQIDDGSLHLPEVCYPAQGFTLQARPNDSNIQTSYGALKVRRLTVNKDNRQEFITYYTMIGSINVRGGVKTKLQQIKYGLNGLIADGMVFRISSIGNADMHNIALHNDFIQSLLSSLNSVDRKRLSGFD
jgi:EpsI family protein